MRNAILAFVVLAAASTAQAGGGFKQKPEVAPTPAPHASMRLRRPICSAVGAGFGEIDDASLGRQVFHTGLDFPAPFGSPVNAAAAGRVTAAERRGPFGLLVEIDHGEGFQTRYSQLQSASVYAGDSVVEGQKIATVGSSGRSAAPHLHFEVTHDRFAYDPLIYLSDDPACATKLPRDADRNHRIRAVGPARLNRLFARPAPPLRDLVSRRRWRPAQTPRGRGSVCGA